MVSRYASHLFNKNITFFLWIRTFVFPFLIKITYNGPSSKSSYIYDSRIRWHSLLLWSSVRKCPKSQINLWGNLPWSPNTWLKSAPKHALEVCRNWLQAYKMRTKLRHDDWSRESWSWRKNNGNGSGEPSYQHSWYCISNWSLEKWSLVCALEWSIIYHLLKVRHLLSEDYGRWEEFSQWIIKHCNWNRFILYTDECQFTRYSFSYIHNDHHWVEENPHARVVGSFQDRFKANVWCGLVGECLIGLHILDQSLNANRYLNFLQNDFLSRTKNLDLEFRKNLI